MNPLTVDVEFRCREPIGGVKMLQLNVLFRMTSKTDAEYSSR